MCISVISKGVCVFSEGVCVFSKGCLVYSAGGGEDLLWVCLCGQSMSEITKGVCIYT